MESDVKVYPLGVDDYDFIILVKYSLSLLIYLVTSFYINTVDIFGGVIVGSSIRISV